MAGRPANALIGDQRRPPAICRYKSDSGCKGVQRGLGVRRLNKIKVQLVAVAVRTTMRPPFCITRALCRRDGLAGAQPDAAQDLPDAVSWPRA
jgi:hypothetical protein